VTCSYRINKDASTALHHSQDHVLLPKEPSTSQPKLPTPAVSHYRYAEASADGIGKFFHGREIAQVMGHPSIGWLERENREDEEAPTKAINALELAPDAVIADIGAGFGYYSFWISHSVFRTLMILGEIHRIIF
jgi:hypothetical protein